MPDGPAPAPEVVQALLDAFVAIASEVDEDAVLEQAVDVARMVTSSRYGAAVLVGEGGISHLAHAGMSARQVSVLPHVPRGHGVLGAVLAERATIRLDRLADHPSSEGFPLGHVPMEAFLGVPLWAESELLGAVYLTKPPGQGTYSATDAALVQAIGRQVGAAVRTVRATRTAAELADRLTAADRLKGSALAELAHDVDPATAIDRILAAARENLGMQLAVVSRIADGVQRMEHLDGDADAFGVARGLAFPVEDGLCHAVVTGAGDGLLPDVAADPAASALPLAGGVGAYAGVPLTLPDGSLHGSLCTLSAAATPLTTADRSFLVVLAELVGAQLQRQVDADAERRRLEAEIAPLFDPDGLVVHVQPIVDLHDGRVVGVEALSRFAGWTRGGPDTAFAAAHEAGVGVDLELVAVQRALALLPDLPPGVYLSVNAGPATVVDPRLARLLADVPPGRVVVEVTEHEALDGHDGVAGVLARLRAAGVRTAVDDTGSGFASLRAVLDLAPDVVKLDAALVRGVDVDPARRALARSLVEFATELGASLVAEGVETRAELDALRALGMHLGQGYHLARPAPLAELDLARRCDVVDDVGGERRDPASVGAPLRGRHLVGAQAVVAPAPTAPPAPTSAASSAG